MGPLGVPEMAVIFILALVLFGPKKLPELGRTIGKAMTEFRRASNDLKATFEREMHTLERENESIQATTRKTAQEISDATYKELTEATYDAVPQETMWNPLEEAMKEEINLDPQPAIETASTQEETPAPVGASEVSGAESTEPAPVETAEVTHVGIEGTVPRGSASEEKITTT